MAVTTQLWSVDPAQRQISFSADADSVHMQRLAQCDEAVAVAYLDSVKLQFDLSDLVLVHGASSCALRAALPAVLYRFQRRASFRVRTFERRAPQARLRHPSMPEMRLALRIVDISVGGCALVLPDDVPALQPGSRLGGVRIELDGDTAFDATLRLQHVSAMHGGGHGMRLGCEFIELDGQAQRTLAALYRPHATAAAPAGAALTAMPGAAAAALRASRWWSCAWCWPWPACWPRSPGRPSSRSCSAAAAPTR